MFPFKFQGKALVYTKVGDRFHIIILRKNIENSFAKQVSQTKLSQGNNFIVHVKCMVYFNQGNQIADEDSSRSRNWSRGGRGDPRHFFRDFADIVKQVNIGWGPEPALGPLEALAILIDKYAFSHFSWFSSNFLMCICVGTLQNIYFKMKDSGHSDKCNIPFLNMRKSRVLFVFSVQFADTLVCEPGVLLHFLISIYESSYYWALFVEISRQFYLYWIFILYIKYLLILRLFVWWCIKKYFTSIFTDKIGYCLS